MKLTKAKLIKFIKPGIEKLGFTEFKDTISGYHGIFLKRLKNGFYLTLGLTIHRYYDSMFTGDYYLSKTTRVASIWGDIPIESEERPGFLLTDEERAIYPEDEINVKGSYDIWWNGNDEKAITDFLKVIEITEPRFINQPELINKIEKSKEVQKMKIQADKVIQSVASNQVGTNFNFLPNKEVDNIPMIWFKAAESVLLNSGGILNANTVKLLATDAYRQNTLQL